MNLLRCPCPGAVLATAFVSLMVLCSAAAGAAPPGVDVTERVRQIIREAQGDSGWGADPPAEEIAERGQPFAATALIGTGHAMVVIGKDGRPLGSHLRLLHVSMEGARATVSDCVLRLGEDEDRSCPPTPLALVDCATWSVPADAARAALLETRAALFVRVYEKKFIADPHQESEDGGEVYGGVAGSVGGSTADFVAVANVMEAGEHPIRVAEAWAGYPSSTDINQLARADAATHVLREAFPRPNDAPASTPPPALHAEFSRLFAKLPLDAEYWWWVRERMVPHGADGRDPRAAGRSRAAQELSDPARQRPERPAHPHLRARGAGTAHRTRYALRRQPAP